MNDREIMQQALRVIKQLVVDESDDAPASQGSRMRKLGIEKALRERLAQPEQEPVSMRMPKAGDKVICLEDESLATVVSLTAGGSPDIVFSDGSRGTYLLHEFAELFGYATQPAAQPTMFGPMGTVGALFDKHVIANGNLKKEWIVYLEKNT